MRDHTAKRCVSGGYSPRNAAITDQQIVRTHGGSGSNWLRPVHESGWLVAPENRSDRHDCGAGVLCGVYKELLNLRLNGLRQPVNLTNLFGFCMSMSQMRKSLSPTFRRAPDAEKKWFAEQRKVN